MAARLRAAVVENAGRLLPQKIGIVGVWLVTEEFGRKALRFLFVGAFVIGELVSLRREVNAIYNLLRVCELLDQRMRHNFRIYFETGVDGDGASASLQLQTDSQRAIAQALSKENRRYQSFDAEAHSHFRENRLLKDGFRASDRIVIAFE
jgi:hypothetical protein